MSVTIPQVRNALTSTLTGITVFSGRVLSGWPNQIIPPCCVVYRRTTEKNVEFNGGDNTTFLVQIYLVPTELVSAQLQMDALLAPDGNQSILGCLTADTSLGGVVNWLTIPQLDEEGLVEMNGIQYYSASIQVLVSHN